MNLKKFTFPASRLRRIREVTFIVLAIAAPLACSSSDPTGRGSAGARGIANNEPAEDASEAPNEEPGEGEEGEAPEQDGGTTPSEDAGTPPPAQDSGTTPPADDSAPPAPAPRTWQVEVDSDHFEPSTLTIKVGDTVKWEWGANDHSVTSGAGCTNNGTFDSGLRNDGASYSHTFTAPGSYDYHCIAHCAMGMVGKVIVEE